MPKGVCPGGCTPRTQRQTPHPLVNRMTDRCKNITLPRTLFAGNSKKHSSRMHASRFCGSEGEGVGYLRSHVPSRGGGGRVSLAPWGIGYPPPKGHWTRDTPGNGQGSKDQEGT